MHECESFKVCTFMNTVFPPNYDNTDWRAILFSDTERNNSCARSVQIEHVLLHNADDKNLLVLLGFVFQSIVLQIKPVTAWIRNGL